MLTKNLADFDLEFSRCGNRITPAWIKSKTHDQYVALANRMLRIYQGGSGRTRGELSRAVEQVFADQTCRPRQIKAFVHILEEFSEFAPLRPDAWKLRLEVFRLASPHHPLSEESVELLDSNSLQIKNDISQKLGRPWAEIEKELCCDTADAQILMAYKGVDDAGQLLAEYNIQQAQACLFYAREMVVTARESFRPIRTAIKFNQLIHHIERTDDGQYRFTLSGVSSKLSDTHRYGKDMGKFLRTLLRCRQWTMDATIAIKKRDYNFHLSDIDKIGAKLSSVEDSLSTIEATFLEKWGSEKSHCGWTVKREDRILCHGQKVAFPDFSFYHTSGLEVLFEIAATGRKST